MVHGYTPEDVYSDKEGCQIMCTLGKNMAFLMKSIQAGKEEKVFTSFCRPDLLKES